MRTTAFLACLGALALVAGCYNPKVTNGGFACSPSDNPPCPSGFQCVGGLCLNSTSGAVPYLDMSLPGGTGGNAGGGGGGGGGSTSTDMAFSSPDFATPKLDMSGGGSGGGGGGGGSCAKQADPCTNNSDCCNMVCFPGGAGSLCLF